MPHRQSQSLCFIVIVAEKPNSNELQTLSGIAQLLLGDSSGSHLVAVLTEAQMANRIAFQMVFSLSRKQGHITTTTGEMNFNASLEA